ncbi:MAG: glucosamine-6-phosphate deaminase [Thauera sp.]|jgi:glucosamine-6-phosphate deaminase|nr:glucosamine-6-phosphate deaminase [Thauera sp.]
MLRLQILPNPQQLAKTVAQQLHRQILSRPHSTLGLATGGTMESVYASFCAQATALQLDGLTTFNLDEYLGLNPDHPQSYHFYMAQHLFGKLPFGHGKTHFPCGRDTDLDAKCERYSAAIQASGGIDLQLLGIGTNGHIGFNEPGTAFDSRTHVVKLTEQTRIDNSRFFEHLDEVPAYAVTMGLQDIMDAKEVILVATGKQKAAIIAQLLSGEVTESLPASILYHHPNAVVYVDQEAASELPPDQQRRCA